MEEEMVSMTQSSQVWTDLSEEVGLNSGLAMRNEKIKEASIMETQRYLISSKWWEKWRDFSNFNTYFLKNIGENNSLAAADDELSHGQQDDYNFTQLALTDTN